MSDDIQLDFSVKDRASVFEIALVWADKDKVEDFVYDFIRRLQNGQFEFRTPEEIEYSDLPAENISIGDNLIISDFLFLYRLKRLIAQRCKWYLDKNEKYVPVDFKELFKQLGKAKLDLTTSRGVEVGFWQNAEKLLKAEICPQAVEMPSSEFDALQGLFDADFEKNEDKKKLNDLLVSEDYSMLWAFARYVKIDKQAFLHWLRLGSHKLNQYGTATKNYDVALPEYNGFWGDEWEGHPKSWNPDIDESHGLILEQAFKYYSDPHDWVKYEYALSQAEKATFSDDKAEIYKRVDDEKDKLRARLISLFHPSRPLLKAQGYTDKPEPQELSYSQLKTMLDGKRLNADESRGMIGQVAFEQITVLKANAPTPNPAPEKANKYNLGTAETKTLFKLIAGMAKVGYGYNEAQERNEATADIVKDTGIDHKTAKKWVEFAIEQTTNKSDT